MGSVDGAVWFKGRESRPVLSCTECERVENDCGKSGEIVVVSINDWTGLVLFRSEVPCRWRKG